MLQNGNNKNDNVAEAKHCLLQGPLKVYDIFYFSNSDPFCVSSSYSLGDG